MFAPARDESNRFILNEWGEQKFVCIDGSHRCLIQMRKWCADPKVGSAAIACKGNWYPSLNTNDKDDLHKMLTMGKKEEKVMIFLLKYLFLLKGIT